MRVNPVSFGKTIQVRGNKQDASKIVRAANDYKNIDDAFKKQVQAIFDDVQISTLNLDGEAQIFETQKGKYFILTGEESKQAYAIKDKAIEYLESCSSLDADLFSIEADSTCSEVDEEIEKLVNRTKLPFVVKVVTNRNGNDRLRKINLKI